MSSNGNSKKRKREQDTADEPVKQQQKLTVGQQTSHIKNKLVRAEMYAKLKSKAKVCRRISTADGSDWQRLPAFYSHSQVVGPHLPVGDT